MDEVQGLLLLFIAIFITKNVLASAQHLPSSVLDHLTPATFSVVI